MLQNLSIANFAIVKKLDIEFNHGMTVITGETGAGKSIAVDAISLCLGARGDAGMVRSNQDKAQVAVSFLIDPSTLAYKWLEEQDLIDLEDPSQLTIRRVISNDGKSKAMINGHLVSLINLKELSSYLIHLYGQHASQILLKPNIQLEILDRYLNHEQLLEQVSKAYNKYQQLSYKLQQLNEQAEKFTARKEILDYQITEIDNLNLEEHEFNNVFNEFSTLSNLDEIISSSEKIIYDLNESEQSALYNLTSALNSLERLSDLDQEFANSLQMINDAVVTVQETISEVNKVSHKYDQDPNYFAQIQERLTTIETAAKKFKVHPQDLYTTFQEIKEEYTQLTEQLGDNGQLEQEIAQAKQQLIELSLTLSQQRKAGSIDLSAKITAIMQDLNMNQASFFCEIDYDPQQLTSHGSDKVRFMLQANLGQQAGELHKVASGGELSRIALAIQVLTSNHLNNGTIIFDEVDVGISGKTSAIVGQMLQQLASKTQVICVTHSPQIASYGDNHYQVAKDVVDQETVTSIKTLELEERISAIANLLGHQQVDQQSLDNARNLLELSKRK